jgi:hypothetical protein
MHPIIALYASQLIQSFPEDKREMYLHVYDLADEFLSIADGIACMAGLKTARPSDAKDGGACRLRGLRIGGWNRVEEFATWLSMMYHMDYHTIMYAVSSGERVGAFVFLPLSEKTYNRIIRGELSDRELKPDDIESPSRFVYMLVLDDYSPEHHVPSIRVPDESRLLAHIHLMLWQIAYFTRGRLSDRPVIVSTERIPDYVKRTRRQGFRPIDTCMKGTGFPIRLLRDPDE